MEPFLDPSHRAGYSVPSLSDAQQARVNEILGCFGIAVEDREAYLEALVGMIETVLDEYVAERF